MTAKTGRRYLSPRNVRFVFSALSALKHNGIWVFTAVCPSLRV